MLENIAFPASWTRQAQQTQETGLAKNLTGERNAGKQTRRKSTKCGAVTHVLHSQPVTHRFCCSECSPAPVSVQPCCAGYTVRGKSKCAWSVLCSACEQLAHDSSGTCTIWYRWEFIMLCSAFIRNRNLEEHHKAVISLLVQIWLLNYKTASKNHILWFVQS